MKKFPLYRRGSLFIMLYLGLSIISILIILVLFLSANNSLESDITDQTINDLESFSEVFLGEISHLSTDIFLITNLVNVHDALIINGDTTEFTSEFSRNIIGNEFLVWLGMKQEYDQIRILDNTGQEIVRANYNAGSPYIVEESLLQEKADRYYFSESIILNDKELYMSVLDLNVENGEIEIENGSPKPVLRVGTPLFDNEGVKLGVVIVNYLANDLFNSLDSNDNIMGNNIEIINEDGYYLYAIDDSIEFGFMYDDLTDEKFSKHHNYDVFSTQSGQIITKKYDGEIYNSIRLTSLELTNAVNGIDDKDLDIVFGSKEFIIFSELDLSENATYKSMITLYVTIAIVALIVNLVIIRLIDESIHLNKENLKRIKYDSLHDLLTTLPNRKNIYDQIQYQIQRKKEFTILFIDFDGFKNVNDQFGHDVGDEALIQGSQRINNSIRFDDVIGRVGGDEFIVILKDLSDKEVVSRVCKSIIKSFSTTFDLSGHIASMGVSIGACICIDNKSSIEDIISKSDKAMYQVKRSGKNNFLIFSKQ